MKIFERVLKRLVTRGQLTVHYARGGSFTVGQPDPAFPNLALRFKDARVPFDIGKPFGPAPSPGVDDDVVPGWYEGSNCGGGGCSDCAGSGPYIRPEQGGSGGGGGAH